MLHAIYSARRPSEIHQKIPFGVPDYKALMYASILEETLMELYNLDKLNTHLRLQNLMVDINYLKAKKYHIDLPLDEDLLNRVDITKLDCPEYKLNKLVADRRLIIKVIQDTYMSLKSDRTFTALGHYVLNNIEHIKYRKKLEEDEKNNEIIKHDVHKCLRLQQRHVKKETLAANAIIYDLTVQIEDQEMTEAVRSRYVDGWQRARTSQHLHVISDIEGVPKNNIYDYKARLEEEQTIHFNIDFHLQITIDDILLQIERWMTRYDKDMEDIELKIAIKKHDYHCAKMEKTAIEEKLAEHDKEMASWITFTSEREKVRLYREKMHNAAVTVQAWWRGVQVRKHLGPHRIPRQRKNKLK